MDTSNMTENEIRTYNVWAEANGQQPIFTQPVTAPVVQPINQPVNNESQPNPEPTITPPKPKPIIVYDPDTESDIVVGGVYNEPPQTADTASKPKISVVYDPDTESDVVMGGTYNEIPKVVENIDNSNPEKYVQLANDQYMLKTVFNSLDKRYQDVAKERGFDVMNTLFKSEHIELPDGSFIKVKDFEELPDKYKQIGRDKGFEAMNKAIEEDQKEFEVHNIKLADGKYISVDDFNALKDKFKSIAIHRGFDAMMESIEADGKDFEARNLKLVDGKYISVDDFNNLPDKYKSVAIAQGFNGMQAAMDKDNQDYEEFQAKLKSGEIIAIPGNQYITKKELDKLPRGTQDVILKSGFSGLEALTAKTWEDVRTGKIISDAEYKKLGISAERDYYHLSVPSGRRELINIASFVAPASKALLPEYTVKDISAAEWGLSGINVALLATAFAPGAISASLVGKGVVTGLSTGGAGIMGYETAKNWSDLSPTQKAMGVGGVLLYAIPDLVTVARNVKITSSKPIPTTSGEVTAWKGLSVANNPVVGMSEGKLVVGARNISLPEAKLILDGYKPETMLETKVFVNTKALTKAGFNQTQVDYLTTTLKDRNLFAGSKSPYLSKEALIEPTARLSADDVNVLMKQFNKYNKEIKNVDLLYGSPTIKSQIAPELRTWRDIHDWDIRTSMNEEETIKFANDTLAEFKKLPGKNEYMIVTKKPTHILKKVDGEWEGIADIHSNEAPADMGSTVEIPKSKLDETGTYSYGRMVAEPAITVKYPGVGEIDIMSLSESGVRKADTILRVRQTPEGVAFRPPERGIAQPGVPKDAADFYVVLRTFKGEGVAEDWLKSWAKAMGYTDKELPGVLPRIRKSMATIAEETPSNLIGYRFKPSKSTATSPGASPTITVKVPSSLGASVSGSLARRISQPVSPYKLSPSQSAAISQAISVASAKLPSPKVSGRTSGGLIPSSLKTSPNIKTSSSISGGTISGTTSGAKSLSPSPKLVSSTSTSPTTVPSPSPRPIPKQYSSPKPSPSPSPSPKPSLSPKPSPSLSPVPPSPGSPSPPPPPGNSPPPPRPPPPGKRIKLPTLSLKEKNKKTIPVKPGTLAWQQGALEVDKSNPGPEPVFKIAEPPEYKVKSSFIPPKGYVDTGNTPKATIQTIGGPVTRPVDKSIGIVTAHADPNIKEIRFSRNIRIVESKESDKPKPKSKSKPFRNRRFTEPRNLGAGVVFDRRGRHLRLY